MASSAVSSARSHDADPAIADFVQVVDGRIHALARAHNRITEDHWGPAPLAPLIGAEAAAFLDEGERIVALGDPVLLNPTAYSTMALVIHELVTNSTKYGSLSVPEGTVTIDWQRDDDGNLELVWRDRNGPTVRAPTRQGFGTTIIERSVPYDLGGEASIDYAPEGVSAKFVIPARHVSVLQASDRPAISFPKDSPGHSEEPPTDLLSGQRVLLLEDSLIIALDAEDIVTRLGATDVSTASSVDAAMDQIELARPTIAVLDINLGNSTSFPVADHLLKLDIPFVFATGYGEGAQFPDQHRGRIVVQKPYTIANIARALAQAMA